MYKNKIQIKSKKFSWESKKGVYSCDFKNCNLKGEYKAPKSIINLNDYYFFCLKHIKEYNQSWNYYKGMSVDQIEYSLRQDVIWNRPSWPINSPRYIINKINNILGSSFDNLFNNEKFNFDSKNKLFYLNLTKDEQKSVIILEIQSPISLEKIKSSYKKLVKKYHPDVNKNDKDAEKNFKEVNAAYKILLKKVLKK